LLKNGDKKGYEGLIRYYTQKFAVKSWLTCVMDMGSDRLVFFGFVLVGSWCCFF
jgi:hypothetical protein